MAFTESFFLKYSKSLLRVWKVQGGAWSQKWCSSASRPAVAAESEGARPALAAGLSGLQCLCPEHADSGTHESLSANIMMRSNISLLNNENNSALSVMLQSERYKDTLYLWHLKSLSSQHSAVDVMPLFRRYDQQASKTVLSMCDQLRLSEGKPHLPTFTSLSHRRLCDIVCSLLSVRTIQPGLYETRSVQHLVEALASQCQHRVSHCSLDEMLLLLSLWSHLTGHHSAICSVIMSRLCHSATRWSATHLVQTMFHANIGRFLDPACQKNIEEKILDTMDELSMDELGIVCLGFFKSSTGMFNPLLRQSLVTRVKRDFRSASQMTLGAIFKVLRHSVRGCDKEMVCDVYDSLVPHIDTFNCTVVTALMNVGSQADICHQAALSSCCSRLLTRLPDMRLKEIERMLMCLQKFNMRLSDSSLADIVAELSRPTENRRMELRYHPDTFISLLIYLSFFHCFPRTLISKAYRTVLSDFRGMSKEIRRKSYLLLCQLHCTLLVLDDQHNLSLSDTFITKNLNDNIRVVGNVSGEQGSSHDRFLCRLQRCLQQVLRTRQNVAKMHILPHFATPDIVVCLSREGSSCSLPDELVNTPASQIKWLPRQQSRDRLWLAVVPFSRYISGTRLPTGNHMFRMRQLQQLGYATLQISWVDCYDPDETRRNLRASIRQILSDHFYSQ